jgi:hypothetical protein
MRMNDALVKSRKGWYSASRVQDNHVGGLIWVSLCLWIELRSFSPFFCSVWCSRGTVKMRGRRLFESL